MAKLKDVRINIDLKTLYGEKIANAIYRHGTEPRNVFYIDGGAVGVGLPERIR